MDRVLAWILPLVLAAIGHALDVWAKSNVGAGGILGALAGVWVALRVHPNGVNGPAVAKRQDAVVVAPEPDPAEAPTEVRCGPSPDDSPELQKLRDGEPGP